MEAIGFLMMAHMISPEELLLQARLMESYGADCVYVTDSAGALTPDGFRDRVRALREGLDIPVGVHAHNNLGSAVANSLAAVEEGATFVDGCCAGLGAGAGNAPLEIIAAVFDARGHRHRRRRLVQAGRRHGQDGAADHAAAADHRRPGPDPGLRRRVLELPAARRARRQALRRRRRGSCCWSAAGASWSAGRRTR